MIPLLLAAAALAAEPETPPMIPDGSRWSGRMTCRSPRAADLARAVLLAERDKDGARRLVLRAITGKGVVADERILSAEYADPEERPVDPSVPRVSGPPPERLRLVFKTADREPVLGGTLAFDAKKKLLTLALKPEPSGESLGGACSGALKRETPK